MAEAADIGANFSNYVGNAGAAGGAFGVVGIETRPLEQLAAYTFYSKKSQWEQKQREADLRVKELADLSDIALNNLKGKDKEQATKEYAQLIKDASEYARKIPKTQQERMENELKWQTQRGSFMNNYNSGKARAIAYEAQKAAINTTVSDAKTKEEQLRQLGEVFNRTDIATSISAVPNFKIKKFDTPKPIKQKFNSIIIGDNQNLSMEGEIYNPKVNSGNISATLLGIKKSPKKGTPEYLNLSELERNQADVQNTMENAPSGWVDAVEPLNEALKKYTDDKGVFDATSFENDNASNTTLINAYNGLKSYDSYNRQHYEQAKSGIFTDKGLKIKLPDTVNPDDFKVGFVDFAKGVNPDQLLGAGVFAQYEGDSFTKKVTETDNAIQRQQLGLRYAELGLEREKLKKANTQDLLAADGILREITDIINIGDVPGNQVNVVDEKTGVKKTVFKIGDPTILQKFGNVDKDGTTTNVPDEARYNPKTNEIDLVYFKRKDDDDKVIETTKTGRNIREIKSLNARTWANMVVQRSGSGAGRGEVNEIIQSVITKNGGDLYKIAQAIKGAAPTNTTTPATEAKATDLNSLDPNGFKKEGKNYRYKDGTLYDAKGNIVK